MKIRLEKKLLLWVNLILLGVILVIGISDMFIFQSIITDKVVKAKIQQLEFMDNNLEDVYSQGEIFLVNIANDTAFRKRNDKIAGANTNTEIQEAQKSMDFYVTSMFENYPEFSHIFIITSNAIILKEKGKDSKTIKLQDYEMFTNFYNKTQLEIALKREFPDNFSNKNFVEGSFVITKVDDNTYLGGVISLEDTSFEISDSIIITDENGRIVFFNNHAGVLSDIDILDTYKEDNEGASYKNKGINGHTFLIISFSSTQRGFNYKLYYNMQETRSILVRLLNIYIILIILTPIICFFAFKKLTKVIALPLNEFNGIILETENFSMEQKIQKFVNERINRLNIGRQINKLYAFNIIPIFIINLIIFTLFYNSIIDITKKDYSELTKQLVFNIDYSMGNYLKLMKDISLDKDIQYLLAAKEHLDKSGWNEEKISSISTIINSKASVYKRLENIRIYDAGMKVVYSGDLADKSREWRDTDLDNLQEVNNIYLWKLPQAGDNVTSILWGIEYLNELQDRQTQISIKKRQYEKVGYIELDIRNLFENSCKAINLNSDNYVLLYDNADQDLYYIYGKGIDKTKNISNQIKNDDFTNTGNAIGLKQEIKKTDWTLLYIISNKQILRSFFPFLYIAVLSILISIMLALFAGFYTTRKITMPLKNLSFFMQMAKIDARHDINIGNEIEDFATIARSFGLMLQRLKGLAEEIKLREIEKLKLQNRQKKAEMVVLQTQINPHFLYNVLISLNSLLMLKTMEKNEEARKMIMTLSKLYRIGVYRGRILVGIKEEIEHAETYFSLQKINYQDEIEIVWNISEESFRLAILKFTLQPLIENAMEHGMKKGKPLSIEVTGTIKEKFFILSVRDNGKGVKKDKLKAIVENISDKVIDEHMGMANIHERIQLYFGKEYGVDIDSEPGKGTVVTLKFPVIYLEQVERGEVLYEI